MQHDGVLAEITRTSVLHLHLSPTYCNDITVNAAAPFFKEVWKSIDIQN